MKVADFANSALRCNIPDLLHKLYDMAESIVRETQLTLQTVLVGLTKDPYLRQANTKTDVYVEVFVRSLLGLSQGLSHWWCQVRRTFFHDLEKMFRPCKYGNSTN